MTRIAEDGLPDDREACRDCTKCDVRRRHCAVFGHNPIVDLKRRCVHFVPRPGHHDMRPGSVRWPGIVEQIAEISRMDREYALARR